MIANSHLQLLSTVIYVVLIFISAIAAVMGSIWIIVFLTRKHIEEKREIVRRHNIGMAMVLASFIWTIGRMCFETIKPIMNVWYGSYYTGISFKMALLFSLGVLGSLLIALISGALVVFLALKILMVITQDIDEWHEIKHGNMAVAVVISVTVIVMGMFFESIISQITLSLFSSLKLVPQ